MRRHFSDADRFSLGAAFVRQVETAGADPYLGEIQLDDVLDYGITTIHGDAESALEIIARLVEVSDFGVKDSEIVENP